MNHQTPTDGERKESLISCDSNDYTTVLNPSDKSMEYEIVREMFAS